MRFILSIFILFLLPASLFACDVCGCSAGTNNLGILPQFQRHFVGMRLNYRGFESHHHGTTYSQENFTTAELWGRFNPHRRWQIFAFVPYNIYQQNMNGDIRRNTGLGDVTLLSNFTLTNPDRYLDSDWKHNLMAGAGLKIPTGAWNRQLVNGTEQNPNLQPGTGSVDYMVNAIYTLRYKQWGLNTDVVYRLNSRNPSDFRFGNRFTAGSRAFYWLQSGKIGLLPSAGAGFEYGRHDLDEGLLVSESGGHCLMGVGGFDIYTPHFSAGVSYQQPLVQELGGGHIQANGRLLFHFIVFI